MDIYGLVDLLAPNIHPLRALNQTLVAFEIKRQKHPYIPVKGLDDEKHDKASPAGEFMYPY